MVEKLLLLVIVLLAAVLRIVPALKLELWLDEAFTFFTREQSFVNLLTFDPPHPPLFYWFLKIWSQINTSEFFLRLPSIIFSLLSLILVFKIATSLKFNKVFPYIAGLFFSLSILNIEQSFQVRMYSLLVFWMLLSFFAFLKLFSWQKTFWYAPFCLANFFGFLTHYTFIFYFLALLAGFAVFYFLSRKKLFSVPKRELVNLKFAFAVSAILMLFWWPVFLFNFFKASKIFFSYPSTLVSIKGIFLTDYVEATQLEWVAFYVLFLLSHIGSAFLIYRSFKIKQAKQFLFWLLIGLFFYLPIIFSAGASLILNHSLFASKRLMMASFFPIFSLGGLVSFLIAQKTTRLKTLGMFLLVCLAGLNGLVLKNHGFYRAEWSGPSYRNAIDFIKTKANLEKEKILFLPTWNGHIFNYYFYDYDRGKKGNLKAYKLGWPDEIKNKEEGIYWLVNPDGTERKIGEILSSCAFLDGPIYYQRAIIYRCEI